MDARTALQKIINPCGARSGDIIPSDVRCDQHHDIARLSQSNRRNDLKNVHHLSHKISPAESTAA